MFDAKKVVIPEVLDVDAMVRLRDHAVRSALWYAERGYSCGMIARKLTGKGYPLGDTPYHGGSHGEGGVIDFIGYALKIVGEVFPQQDEYALDLEKQLAQRGHESTQDLRTRLYRNGFSESQVQDAVREYDEVPACLWVAQKRAKRYVRNNDTLTSEDLRTYLVRRGFTNTSVDAVLSDPTIKPHITGEQQCGDSLSVANIFQEVMNDA